MEMFNFNPVNLAWSLVGVCALLFFAFRKTPIILEDPLVIDGDTIFSQGIKYRIYGIDAPEMVQPGGAASKAKLEDFLRGQSVSVEATGKDPYGRVIARIYVKKKDIGRLMVNVGFARAAFHPDYREAERTAKRKRRGLWAKADGIPDPASFRRKARK